MRKAMATVAVLCLVWPRRPGDRIIWPVSGVGTTRACQPSRLMPAYVLLGFRQPNHKRPRPNKRGTAHEETPD
jgi:hypothetical protein